MEELVRSGEVLVNGVRAQLGARVAPADRIEVRGQVITQAGAAGRAPRVLVYHKPEGEIVSRDDPEGRPSVFDRVSPVRRGRWLTVGRLDFNTCGLLLFTDSGELANRLMHPRFGLEREYAVRVLGELTDEQIAQLRRGIELDDGPGRFERIEPQGGEGANHWYQVVVKEGRNRLVRRMFEAFGFTVSRLMRTRFGPFALPPGLRRGHWEQLDAEALGRALGSLGLEMPETAASGARGTGAARGRESRPQRPEFRRAPRAEAERPRRPPPRSRAR